MRRMGGVEGIERVVVRAGCEDGLIREAVEGRLRGCFECNLNRDRGYTLQTGRGVTYLDGEIIPYQTRSKHDRRRGAGDEEHAVRRTLRAG